MAHNTGPALEVIREKGRQTRDAVEAFVTGFCRQHPYGPSLAEVAAAVGIAECSASYPVKLLIAEGRLVRDPGIVRSLRPAREVA